MTRVRDESGDVGPTLAAELLAAGRLVALRARGSSMAPLVRDGDVLTLAPLASTPRAGELVAALCAGRLIVHRVVRARPGQLELQGDALWSADGWFECQSLVYKSLGLKSSAVQSMPAPGEVQSRCVIGRAVELRCGGRALGRWRLGGARARLWLAVLPLVRALRGLWRHAAARLPVRAG